jgi:uncharacterized radical SAM superfamily Fe-S cluster-containing enzyme
VEALKSAGLDSVFLQFDSLDPKIYQKIRGRNLLDGKLAPFCAYNLTAANGRRLYR